MGLHPIPRAASPPPLCGPPTNAGRFCNRGLRCAGIGNESGSWTHGLLRALFGTRARGGGLRFIDDPVGVKRSVCEPCTALSIRQASIRTLLSDTPDALAHGHGTDDARHYDHLPQVIERRSAFGLVADARNPIDAIVDHAGTLTASIPRG